MKQPFARIRIRYYGPEQPAGWRFALCFAMFLTVFSAQAQESTVELGKKTIALDEPFAITLVIRNAQQPSVYSPFPDIKGMQKRDVVLVTTRENVAGKQLTVQRVTQNYMATDEGTYTLPDFPMTINGREVRTKGTSVAVGPPINPDYKLLLDSTLAKEISAVAAEYGDVKDDAFLAFSIDKPTVYVGEGFTASLALYIADNSRAALESYRPGEQIAEILKQIKPDNCWEEDFRIREFQSFPVTIKGRRYTQYKMYQATFYPFNTDTVRFGQVGFTMRVKQGNRKESYQTFYAYPKTVTVNPLPPHPLRGKVAVGTFRLEEAVSRKRPVTGRGLYHQFKIMGEGNFSAVNLAPPVSDVSFEFFPPESKLSLNLTGRRVTGEKLFQTYVLPKEPGRYEWKKYFQWVYFNTEKRAYDTLRSGLVLMVNGQSLRNQSISANELGPVYERMNTDDNRLRPLAEKDRLRWGANILVGVMMAITLVLILWPNRKS